MPLAHGADDVDHRAARAARAVRRRREHDHERGVRAERSGDRASVESAVRLLRGGQLREVAARALERRRFGGGGRVADAGGRGLS